MPARSKEYAPNEPLPGTKYRIVRQLGAGGMGVVYQVVKPPEIMGVLKLMSAELAAHAEFRDRFLDEVRVLAQLDHPNIVKVSDYDKLSDGTPFYVMELLHGRTVRDVIATVGRVPPRVAFEVTRQLLEALHCAHTHSIQVVHRDIKPENIFLHAPKHGEPIVKLIDFGVVALSDREHDGQFVGTWRYAAPEQIRGERATPATDLYSVGLVLYEMLAGAGPFDALETGSLLSQAHLTQIPTPVSKLAPWVPASIVELIQSALAKDPRARPKDAYAFVERLFELEWASSGAPSDRTAQGPSPNDEIGPLARVLSSVSAGKPSSKNLTAAKPASDRLGDVPLIGVPPEARYHGQTRKGIGKKPETTTPDDDELLAGLLDHREREPFAKKVRDSEVVADASPRSGQVVIRPSGPDVVRIGVRERSDRESSIDESPRAPVSRPVTAETIDGPRSAPARENDTFASNASDARPKGVPRSGPGKIIAIAAAGASVLAIVIAVFFLTRRPTTETKTVATSPPPPAASSVPAPEQTASAPPVEAPSASAEVPRPTKYGPRKRGAKIEPALPPSAPAIATPPATTAKPAGSAGSSGYITNF